MLKIYIRRVLNFIVVTLLLMVSNCYSQSSTVNHNLVNIIPKPLHVELKSGSFIIKPNTKIIVQTNNNNENEIAKYFVDRIGKVSGFNLFIKHEKSETNTDGTILFSIENIDENIGDEGYILEVKNKSVTIKAKTNAGLFYGVQSLFQLLPPEIFGSKKLNENFLWSIPAVKIVDKPQFMWRGMHLDVSRHFFSKESVKRYIDMLAMHKMNLFHWHLVDDQGWRIEIKKYPKLTEIGAKRFDLPWNGWQSEDTTGIPIYSGYYKQDDIKEIVAYAQKRSITILPEIEMPGHTLASLAAYPELSCTGGPFIVPSGGVDIWTNHTYCPGNEKTFEFLEDVLSEIIELFPSKYIHIGGDETTRVRWKDCSKCQQKIKDENLKGEEELYGYFIERIEKFLKSKDKVLIGWDEILEGNESLNGTVMSWRGIDRSIKAVNRSLDVIQAPSSHLYFDDAEIDGESRVPLEMVYSYNPVPDGFSVDDAKHILGAEACVWTEGVTTLKQVEKITLPRMAALAEVVWSAKENHNFEDFLNRLSYHYARFDAMKLNYRHPDLEGGFNGIHVFRDSVLIKILKPRLDSEVRYTIDGSEPTTESQYYDKPFYIKNSLIFKAREFLSDGTKGRVRVGNYEKQELQKSVDVGNNIEPGITYKYVEGKYNSTSEIPLNKFERKGIINKFIFPTDHKKMFFAVLYSGFILISEDDVYSFYSETNDGSQLFIDDKLVVDHGGLHPAEEKNGSIALQAGYHRIKVIYFQNAGSSFLKISYSGEKIMKQEIPFGVLFH